MPPELKKVSILKSEELKLVISKHFRMKKEEIAAVLVDKNSSALDLIVASTIAHAIKKGDVQKAEYLFMRLIGRVTEKVEVQYPEPVVIERPNGEQMVLDVASDEVTDD